MSPSNPIFSFRAPAGLKRHPHLDGDHFNTVRSDATNDTGSLNIYNGMFRYRTDPTMEVDFAIWEDTPLPTSRANYYNLTANEHYHPCMDKDWEVVEEAAKLIWKRDVGGRLTWDGAAVNTLVLLWRTAEEAEHAQKAKTKMISQINKTPQEMQAQRQEAYGSLGATVSVTLEDEDEASDAAMANYEHRLASKDL